MANHNDLAKNFVEGTYPAEHVGAMRYEKDKAFSYDVLIARKAKGVLLINNMPYSTSTAAHRGKIRNAAKDVGMPIIEVPNLYFEHEVNLQHFSGVRRELEHRKTRARLVKPIQDSLDHLDKTEQLYRGLFMLDAKEAA
ncbi:hypothetical protein [Shinella zoogloeoides]|uniref:hypothetical protein n=1 Tax=Shinella zoogloeoides TaxID=352475 RepID=UPI00273EF1F0|nr:hypothetical protein [Shinella zoogloeoides]WLR90912.1 hypothetical protein Q9316_00615 [Shinella zoogloeoides]